MACRVDKQTLEDLNLLGKFKHQSIFSLFNHTQTRAGERLLEAMFRNPMSATAEINARAAIMAFFRNEAFAFPIDADQHEQVDDYLRRAVQPNRLASFLDSFGKKAAQSLGINKTYDSLYTGVVTTLKYLQAVRAFVTLLLQYDVPKHVEPRLKAVDALLQDKRLLAGYQQAGKQKIGMAAVATLDYLFRSKYSKPLLEVLALVVEMDVYCTVGRVAATRGFAFAIATADAETLEVDGFYHPWIADAVPNAVSLHRANNMLFLTGANMAGKSTLMKAFSIVVYLAHMGFPVPAVAMRFTPFEGMYTSINVSDNLDMGYSHFYAEVQRVKHVAQEVAVGKRLLVVFDELFKGTNVKDAYDATVAVTHAFSRYRRCSFIISTHITEAGESLQQSESPFRFAFMPTDMMDGKPQYTYVLRSGISDDRHGMVIINNEKIVEIIHGPG